MRANLLSLQSTAQLLGQTQLRLATGNKVNSALDNPVNFFAAQNLTNRAGDLAALLDGMGQAVQVLKSTDSAITSLTKSVNQLKSLANSAKSALGSISSTEVSLMTGDGTSGFDSADQIDLLSGNGEISGGWSAADSFSIQIGTGPAHTFTLDDVSNGGIGTADDGTVTVQDLLDAINSVEGLQATLIDGTDATDDENLIGTKYLKVISTTGEALTVTDITGSIAADMGLADSATVAASDLSSYQTSYAEVITQLDQTVLDASYQGSNLIDGTGSDLTVQVNEKSQNAISVDNKDLTATGLGLTTTVTWTDTTSINNTIDLINTALTTLRTTASSFSNSLSLIQNRQDFTTNLISTLKDGASQLTIADKNEEGANMLALQTAQQLGIQSLSLASQANQSVLRLFA